MFSQRAPKIKTAAGITTATRSTKNFNKQQEARENRQTNSKANSRKGRVVGQSVVIAKKYTKIAYEKIVKNSRNRSRNWKQKKNQRQTASRSRSRSRRLEVNAFRKGWRLVISARGGGAANRSRERGQSGKGSVSNKQKMLAAAKGDKATAKWRSCWKSSCKGVGRDKRKLQLTILNVQKTSNRSGV